MFSGHRNFSYLIDFSFFFFLKMRDFQLIFSLNLYLCPFLPHIFTSSVKKIIISSVPCVFNSTYFFYIFFVRENVRNWNGFFSSILATFKDFVFLLVIFYFSSPYESPDLNEKKNCMVFYIVCVYMCVCVVLLLWASLTRGKSWEGSIMVCYCGNYCSVCI